MNEPAISVVVTAHTNKDFLLDAVNSALNQTLPKEEYEVIVVKNFRDEFVDAKLDALGVTNVYSKEQGIGAKMCEALDFIRAKVVTFLDYDDEYCERRLEKVKAWMLDQNTGYYHNSYVYINEKGAELSRASIKKRAKRVEDFQKRSLFKELLKEGAYANASSIAVSRKLLEDSKELLKRITAVPDLFLFFFALTSKLALVVDYDTLTKYRLHLQNSFSFTSLQPFEQQLNRLRARCNGVINDLLTIFEFVKRTPYEHELVKRLIYWRLKAKIFSGHGKLGTGELFRYVFSEMDSNLPRRAKDCALCFLPSPLRMAYLKFSFNRKKGVAFQAAPRGLYSLDSTDEAL
jgi:glycosyltransferase involved in cell wall biosynthesis